jgi:hypothetical protein
VRSLSRPEDCISDLAFDELHAGELAAPARLALESHLARCERCRARASALAAERRALLAVATRLPVLSPRARPRTRLPLPAAAVTALAVAACALLWLKAAPEPSEPDARRKGAPHLGMFIKRGERVWRAESRAVVRAGDRLRFTYSSDRECHLALLGLDAQHASVYLPEQAKLANRALRILPGTDVALDFGVELDASAGEERVHGIFCAQSFELEPLRAALEAKRALPELPSCTVDTLVLSKERAR